MDGEDTGQMVKKKKRKEKKEKKMDLTLVSRMLL